MGIAYSPTQRLSKTAGTNANQARSMWAQHRRQICSPKRSRTSRLPLNYLKRLTATGKHRPLLRYLPSTLC
jgi:hypothetical protein